MATLLRIVNGKVDGIIVQEFSAADFEAITLETTETPAQRRTALVEAFGRDDGKVIGRDGVTQPAANSDNI